MSLIVDLFSRLSFLYLGVFTGFVFAQFSFFKRKGVPLFYKIAIWIATPFLIIGSILTINIEEQLNEFIYPVIISILFTSIGYLLIRWQLKNNQDYKFEEKAAIEALAAYPNTLNFPFPVIIAFAGIKGLIPATIVVFMQIILRNTLGVYTSTANKNSSIGRKQLLKKILLFPPVFSVFIAIGLWLGIGPIPLNEHNSYLVTQKIMIFILLMTIGFELEIQSLKNVLDPTIRIVSIGRFGGGIIVAAITLFLPIPSYAKIALFIQSFAPPAVNNQIYAKYFGLDVKLTSKGIVTLTAIALLILPFEIAFLLFIT